MRRKHTVRKWMPDVGLPEDVLTGEARITLYGKQAVQIEGQCGVVEMRDERIRMKSKSGIISIEGNALLLKELTLDAAVVKGKEITAVLMQGARLIR